MNKAAFTMIELVFVIVILGILAAVVVLKIAASRSDAAVTAALASFKQTTDDIKATALASNAMSANLIDMTTSTNKVIQGDGNNGASTNGIVTKSDAKTCLGIEPIGTVGFKISYGVDINDNECSLIKSAFTSPETVTLLGNGVSRK